LEESYQNSSQIPRIPAGEGEGDEVRMKHNTETIILNTSSQDTKISGGLNFITGDLSSRMQTKFSLGNSTSIKN
jgi:hypothetical protein